MKLYKLLLHMSPRELGHFLSDVRGAGTCMFFPGDARWCKKWLSCAGCYTTWLHRDIDVRWCSACRWYDGNWGQCTREGGKKFGVEYNRTCQAWTPADWWEEQKKNCRTCRHRDIYDGKRDCGNYRPEKDEDGQFGCEAWEPMEEVVRNDG